MYTDFLSSSRVYAFLWQKYRPALLKLMVDSETGPQKYPLSKHEIKSVHPNERGGYSFTLKLYKGKSVNDIRKSAIAKDLLGVMQQSKKALELAELAAYEFKLDKSFVLHVSKEVEKEIVVEEKLAESAIQ